MLYLGISAAAVPEVRQLVPLCCCWLVAFGGLCYSPAKGELGISRGLHHTVLLAVVELASRSAQPWLGCFKDVTLCCGAA